MKTDPQPIRYGMFIMPFHPPSKPTAQCYDEDLELIVLAGSLASRSSGSASITR
jgi:hypothetical protein